MNELPRINNLTPVLTVNTHSQVTPVHQTTPIRHIDDKSTTSSEYDRRRQQDRRQRNKKPVVERRVSSDRRGPRFDAKA